MPRTYARKAKGWWFRWCSGTTTSPSRRGRRSNASYDVVRRFRHPQWDVEHVMLALLENAKGVPVQLLEKLGVDAAQVRSRARAVSRTFAQGRRAGHTDAPDAKGARNARCGAGREGAAARRVHRHGAPVHRGDVRSARRNGAHPGRPWGRQGAGVPGPPAGARRAPGDRPARGEPLPGVGPVRHRPHGAGPPGERSTRSSAAPPRSAASCRR